MKLTRYLRLVSAALAFAWLAGCTTTAPAYPMSVSNLQALKYASGTGVNIGQFSAEGAAANNDSITLRAMKMTAANGTYSKYLHDAVLQDLTEAGLINMKSGIQITAVLLRNDISAAGISTASGEVEARFTVTNRGLTVFDKTKRGALAWDSHFMGDIAIARARDNYPNLVTALLRDLYTDPDFIKSIKQ